MVIVEKNPRRNPKGINGSLDGPRPGSNAGLLIEGRARSPGGGTRWELRAPCLLRAVFLAVEGYTLD